jgi:hypothetical protein
MSRLSMFCLPSIGIIFSIVVSSQCNNDSTPPFNYSNSFSDFINEYVRQSSSRYSVGVLAIFLAQDMWMPPQLSLRCPIQATPPSILTFCQIQRQSNSPQHLYFYLRLQTMDFSPRRVQAVLVSWTSSIQALRERSFIEVSSRKLGSLTTTLTTFLAIIGPSAAY